MSDKIWLSSPHMSDEGYEMEYIREAFDTNWIAPLGTNVDKFEEELANYVGTKHAVALSSGTAAIHMALKAAEVGKDDIVFCQDLTFSASANPIIYQNAIPVFIDSNYETWNMCPEALERAFEKYPDVKAVIVVHLYGLSADLDNIIELCKKYNVVLIEDAAESLGTTYKGKHTGTFGGYGIFSFNGNKIITTSGGGMLVSNNEERIKKVKFWATQARDKARHYQHSELGFNYRMSNVLAGIGRGQLKVLDKRVAKKKCIFEYYKRELGGLKGIQFMPINDWNEPNYWLSCITLHHPNGCRGRRPCLPDNVVHSDDESYAMQHHSCEGRGRRPCLPDNVVHGDDESYAMQHHSCEGRGRRPCLPDSVVHGDDESRFIKPIDIIKALEHENIEARPIWKPMHMQPYFEEYDFIGEGVSKKLFENGVCLPSDTKMTDGDLERVVRVIKGLWE